MDEDEDDDGLEPEVLSWPWSWWCLPTAFALGVRATVESLAQDVLAAYNYHRFQMDQQQFERDAHDEIESLTREV